MLKMSPCFQSYYTVDGKFGDIIFFSQIFMGKVTGSIFCSNGFNCYLVKFFVSIFNTFAAFVSIFFYHVSIVFSSCTQKKMMRIYAGSIIAFMTYAKIFFNCSFKNNIRNSMSTITKRRFDPSVSYRIDASYPFPTFVEWDFFYFIKKSFNMDIMRLI